MSVAAAKEIRVEAAEVAVLSQPDGMFSLEEERRRAPKDFLGRDIFVLLTAGFGLAQAWIGSSGVPGTFLVVCFLARAWCSVMGFLVFGLG